VSRGKYTYAAAVLAALFSVILIVACKEGTTSVNPSPTDVVKITDINAFISKEDLAAGTVKTNGYVAPVMMPHQKHEDAGIQCTTCHHKFFNDDRIKQCAYCHKGKKGDETLHALCINCHLEKKKGPTMCQDCHKTENGQEEKK
jgi:hypothetical protein